MCVLSRRRVFRRLRAVPAAALALAAAAAAAGCAPQPSSTHPSTTYAVSGGDVVVSRGVGGYAQPIFERYNAFAASGRRVVVDGHVISADAFGAFAQPRMCYTHKAVWSPHAVTIHFTEMDPEGTRQVASYLPDPLERFFLAHPASRDPRSVPRIGYDQLVRIWPEGSCDPVSVGLAKFRAAAERNEP
ncbi:MAG: hypothetical protein AAF676_02765 [Pseudomonadota bacterium]